MKRIESLLKQEIAHVIQQDFRSNLGLISITSIKVSKDLANATIFYSHLGSKEQQRKSFEKLNKSVSFIQRQLNKTLRLKRIPILKFKLDNSLEAGSNIITQLNELTDTT